MWDWSIKSEAGKVPEKKTPVNSYKKGINPVEDSEHIIPPQANIKAQTEQLLHTYRLDNMQLIKQPYAPKTWEEMHDIFNKYQRNRTAFLKMCGYNKQAELLDAGFQAEDIELLKKGIAPENYNTHLKIPFDFGGGTDFENFSLIRTHHTHSNIHRIIDYQISSGFLLKEKFIYLPSFDGAFYHEKKL